MERRLLSPAEAVQLIAPGTGSATACVQAGLLGLVDAGRIQFHPAPKASDSVLELVPLPAADPPMPRHLLALEQALLGYGKGRRLTSTQVIHALQRTFGANYRRYVHDEVAASLVRRGLLARIDGKWLGLFPRIRYERTALGRAMAIPLDRLRNNLERIPSLLESDPERALKLARAAGVLLLLAPKVRQQVAALRKLFVVRGTADGVYGYVPLDEGEASRHDTLLELGDMSLHFNVDALFDAVESVGDFTGGGDGSSDGGDGGGDGGGGGD